MHPRAFPCFFLFCFVFIDPNEILLNLSIGMSLNSYGG